MKRYRINPNETSFYYSTCTIVNWIPVFQSEAYFPIMVQSLIYCQKHKGPILHGYIIMPTHIKPHNKAPWAMKPRAIQSQSSCEEEEYGWKLSQNLKNWWKTRITEIKGRNVWLVSVMM